MWQIEDKTTNEALDQYMSTAVSPLQMAVEAYSIIACLYTTFLYVDTRFFMNGNKRGYKREPWGIPHLILFFLGMDQYMYSCNILVYYSASIIAERNSERGYLLLVFWSVYFPKRWNICRRQNKFTLLSPPHPPSPPNPPHPPSFFVYFNLKQIQSWTPISQIFATDIINAWNHPNICVYLRISIRSSFTATRSIISVVNVVLGANAIIHFSDKFPGTVSSESNSSTLNAGQISGPAVSYAILSICRNPKRIKVINTGRPISKTVKNFFLFCNSQFFHRISPNLRRTAMVGRSCRADINDRLFFHRVVRK